MLQFTDHPGISYILGFFTTGTVAFMTDVPAATGIGFAALFPGIVLLLVHLPKLIREAILLYREIRTPNSTKNLSDSVVK
jgi:hypothetical protein